MGKGRRQRVHALVFAVLLASCVPRATSTLPPSATATAVPEADARLIRFALVGGVSDVNVWSLFNGIGYSYNNYAVRAAYWPRLYGLSVPEGLFEAVAARDLPDAMHTEGVFYAATVPLRTDMRWTDGTPFTAEDVAFTVNTALKFHLGFDWEAYYNREWLDHTEATAPDAVTFYFRRAPSVAVWQYGTLQGPVVQQRYWSPKVAAASALLPSDDVPADLEVLKSKISVLQHEVDTLYAGTLSAQGTEARQLQADLRRQQGNLDEATNDLAKAELALENALNAARAALHEQADNGEPHLGRWTPSDERPSSRRGSYHENTANLDFPGAPPNFAQARYYTFETQDLAAAALERDEIDVILDPASLQAVDGTSAMRSPTRSLRLLVFNPKAPALRNAGLRRALACMLNQDELVGTLEGRGIALHGYVADSETTWRNKEASLPCAALDEDSRIAESVSILRDAGYLWEREPSVKLEGRGLSTPDGAPLGSMGLLTPASDELRASAASYVEQRAQLLGINLSVQAVPAEAMDYAVLSDQSYDMALLGWTVSSYPAYLCEWFNVGGPFHYDPSRLISSCGEVSATSDLERVRTRIREIQQILAEDLPMIPLYAVTTYDSYHNVVYPFNEVLGGLSGVYGAPELAVPAAP